MTVKIRQGHSVTVLTVTPGRVHPEMGGASGLHLHQIYIRKRFLTIKITRQY